MAASSEYASEVDGRKIRNREASRRFRQKQKHSRNALQAENEQLKDELEQLRKQLEGVVVDGQVVCSGACDRSASSVIASLASDMRSAIQHAVTNLRDRLVPSALIPAVETARRAANAASVAVVRVAKELARSIHPLAYFEMNLWTLLTWMRLKTAGQVPEDEVLRAVYFSFEGPEFAENPPTPAQLEQLRAFLAAREDKYAQILETKRRLRVLLEEAGALAAEAERDDQWLAQEHQAFFRSVFTPDQVAARIAWNVQSGPLLQERVLGRLLGGPGSPSTVAAAAEPAGSFVGSPQPEPAAALASSPGSVSASGASSPGSPPLPPAPVSPAALCPLPGLPLPAAAPPAWRGPGKRPAAEPPAPVRAAPAPPASPAVGPAPAGAAIPADLLREIVGRAVSRELARFLQDPTLLQAEPLCLPTGAVPQPATPHLPFDELPATLLVDADMDLPLSPLFLEI